MLDATNYELLANAYELQQQNIVQLKENNTSIKESNSLLKEKLNTYEELIEEQSEKLSQLESQILLPKSIDKDSRNIEDNTILSFLSKNSQAAIYKDHLSSHLGLQDAKTQYYLDSLLEDKLVRASYNMSRPTKYSLTKQGRAYLVENDLL